MALSALGTFAVQVSMAQAQQTKSTFVYLENGVPGVLHRQVCCVLGRRDACLLRMHQARENARRVRRRNENDG
jgi:hypothetical protein